MESMILTTTLCGGVSVRLGKYFSFVSELLVGYVPVGTIPLADGYRLAGISGAVFGINLGFSVFFGR